MPAPSPGHPPSEGVLRSGPALRAALSVTLGALLTISPARTAKAGDILRGGAFSVTASSHTTTGASNGMTPAQAAAAATAKDRLARTTQALQAMQAMQAAARNLARSGGNNLGLDPNHAGKQLPNIPNGLAT